MLEIKLIWLDLTCFFNLNFVLVNYVNEIRQLMSCVNKYGGCQ